jgi:serine/threonine protein kinase
MPGQEPDNDKRKTPDLISDQASAPVGRATDGPGKPKEADQWQVYEPDEGVTNTRVVPKSALPEAARVGEIIFERWKIIERLGEGGMASVYKAHHLILDKVVAIKFLHRHLCSNPSSLRRFQQEGQAAGRLDHPNVIKVQDCAVTDDGRVFLVMDYLQGQSLSDTLKQDGPLSAEGALDLFIAIAEGLKHAHSNGVLHRDLKPSNVMVTNENEIKIVDFGIAKVLRDDGQPSLQNLTKTGEIFGSPSYMSPEQCLGKPVDARSDIYSMGCLMYEVLTGQPPFQGNNSLDTIRMHIEGTHEPIVPDSTKDSGLYRLDLVINKALEKAPEARYQNVDELIADLELVKQAPGKIWAERRKELDQRNKEWHGPSIPIGQILLYFIPILWVGGILGWLYLTSPKGNLDLDNYQYSFWMVLPVKTPDHADMSASIDDKMGKAIRRALSKNDPVEVADTYSEAGKVEERYGEWVKGQRFYSEALRLRTTLEKNSRMKTLQYIQDLEGLANCLAQEHKLSAANNLYEEASQLYGDYRETEESKAQFHAVLLAEICKSQLTGHIVSRQSSIKTLNGTIEVLRAAMEDCSTLLSDDFEKHALLSQTNLRNTIQSEQVDLLRRLIVLEHHPDRGDFNQCREDYEAALHDWESAKDLNAQGKCYFALALLDGKQNSPNAMAGNLYKALIAFRQAEKLGQETSELSDRVLPAYLELCWKNFPWRLILHPPPR